jgi:hypothetical protein
MLDAARLQMLDGALREAEKSVELRDELIRAQSALIASQRAVIAELVARLPVASAEPEPEQPRFRVVD